jgi:hypothetical protein
MWVCRYTCDVDWQERGVLPFLPDSLGGTRGWPLISATSCQPDPNQPLSIDAAQANTAATGDQQVPPLTETAQEQNPVEEVEANMIPDVSDQGTQPDALSDGTLPVAQQQPVDVNWKVPGDVPDAVPVNEQAATNSDAAVDPQLETPQLETPGVDIPERISPLVDSDEATSDLSPEEIDWINGIGELS